ncbi:MAG: hypothetical protein AAF628_10685 [Planctomycetota bacterium]
MRPITSALVALSWISMTAAAAAQDRRTAASWRDFRAQHGDDWRADWNPATGTPQAIYGPGLRLRAGLLHDAVEVRELAEQAIRRHAALLGCGTSTYELDIQARVGDLHILVFRQRYRGLPVVDGRIDVRITAAGVLAMLGSRALPVPATLGVVPRLDAAAAPRAAGIDPGGDAPAPRLVVWGDAHADAPTTPRLAWEVPCWRDGQPDRRAFIDADRGLVLEWVSDVHTCGLPHATPHPATQRPSKPPAATPSTSILGTIHAWTPLGPLPTVPATKVPLPNLLVQIPGGASAFTAADGTFDIPHTGTAPVQIDLTLVGRRIGRHKSVMTPAFRRTVTATPGTPINVTIYSRNADEGERAQTAAYWFVDAANEFVRTYLGDLPQLDLLDGIKIENNLVGGRAIFCNASYFNSTLKFHMGVGACAHSAYNSIVIHEWAHGLDDVFGGLDVQDGQSEGSADILSILVNDDPTIAPDFWGPATRLRSARNRATYPKRGSIHEAGMPWMGYCWDVRDGLVAKLGHAAGLAQLRKIFLGVFPADPTGHPSAVLEVFLLDDDDGDLTNGTPNSDVLIAAAMKRNLPYPGRDTAAYTTFGQGCHGPTLGPRGLPALGSTFDLALTAHPDALTVLLFGHSDQVATGGGQPLPFALNALGAPGCELLVSGETQIRLVADAAGRALFPVAMPRNPGLIGQTFFNQLVVVDPSANPLGVALSQGGAGRIGVPAP